MNIFNNTLQDTDKVIYEIIKHEKARQNNVIELIASENFVSPAVPEAQGSVLTNKYAEGYPAKRFYNGCEEVDKAENLAIERVKKLFNCKYANVQPHSGSQANRAVYLALLKPGDTILSMSLDSGGHLTHGTTPNMSGKWFNAVSYSVNNETYLIDYDEIERLANLHQPQLIIAGFSAYPRNIDIAKFREIADKVGAHLMADIAHIAGLVATGEHQSPIPYAHIITIITRLRIGHTALTHAHILEKKQPEICETCNSQITVNHILMQCTKYQQIRVRLNMPTNLQDILNIANTHKLISYLKETGLYNKI